MNLLLLCAAARPSPDALRRAAAAVSDWDPVLERAACHGLSPLLAWSLAASCPERVPESVMRLLRERSLAAASRMLRYSAELARIAGLFEQSGIPLLAFKGPTLAWSYYDNPCLRETSDLDLLVAPEHVESSIQLLCASGYTPSFPAGRRFFHSNREMPFHCAARGSTVDLHWALAPSHLAHALDLRAFRSRLVQVNVAGRPVPTLAPTDLLLYLCVHGAKHGWSSLGWLADIVRILDRGPVDWDALLSCARARRATRILFFGLLLCRALLGTALPPEVAACAQADVRSSSLAAAAAHRIQSGQPSEGGVRAGLKYQLLIAERKRDRLRLCLAHLQPTPADFGALAMPRALFPAYYAVRPARLLLKYAVQRATSPREALTPLPPHPTPNPPGRMPVPVPAAVAVPALRPSPPALRRVPPPSLASPPTPLRPKAPRTPQSG